MGEETQISRRRFHAMAVWAIGGFISAGRAIPALAYIISPALQSTKPQEWIRLGSTSKVELGIPTLFKVTVEQQTGWITNEQELSVYVLTDNGRDYAAMSNICTHLGCRVRWMEVRAEWVLQVSGVVRQRPPGMQNPKLATGDVEVEVHQLHVLNPAKTPPFLINKEEEVDEQARTLSLSRFAPGTHAAQPNSAPPHGQVHPGFSG